MEGGPGVGVGGRIRPRGGYWCSLTYSGLTSWEAQPIVSWKYYRDDVFLAYLVCWAPGLGSAVDCSICRGEWFPLLLGSCSCCHCQASQGRIAACIMNLGKDQNLKCEPQFLLTAYGFHTIVQLKSCLCVAYHAWAYVTMLLPTQCLTLWITNPSVDPNGKIRTRAERDSERKCCIYKERFVACSHEHWTSNLNLFKDFVLKNNPPKVNKAELPKFEYFTTFATIPWNVKCRKKKFFKFHSTKVIFKKRNVFQSSHFVTIVFHFTVVKL